MPNYSPGYYMCALYQYSKSSKRAFFLRAYRSVAPCVPAQIRVVADDTKNFVNWAEMDFRLGRVRDGSHKDCWLVERAIIKDSGHDTK